jgi:nucleoside-diphosphate-sugar epimerase
MPSALPARFRRARLLIVGCGDVGLRVARGVQGRWRVLALSSSPARREALRMAGITPLWGDLDRPATLGRLAGLAPWVLHLAPPPAEGESDPRTAHLLQALGRKRRVRALVYGSTTGVYGDRAGAWVRESDTVVPATARARRRVDAERRVREYGRGHRVRVSLLRIPGIYAADRAGGDPRERVAQGLPVLRADEDVYTNHIHADDLARICLAALLRGRIQRVVHASDDTELRMGDYLDLVADAAGLPRPPRISRDEARATMSPVRLSFLSESRRLRNERLKRELRVRLRYPSVLEGIRSLRPA